jgi:hypothetical protein
MKSKVKLIIAAGLSLAVMGLQGCFYSSPTPAYGGYYGTPNYYSGPAYRTFGNNVQGCNNRRDACVVCDNEGHHCHTVRE